MPILRYLSIFLASALVASYAALWLANPAPLEQRHSVVRPPLIIEQQGDVNRPTALSKILGCWLDLVGRSNLV